MKSKVLVIVLLFSIFSNSENDFGLKIDSLRQFIPIVTGNQIFSFKEISEDVWKWNDSQKFISIDSVTWCNNFYKPINRESRCTYDYRNKYYYKKFDFKDDLFNLIILDKGNDNSYMYLVQFDKQGNQIKTLTLASIYKHPYDYEEIYSSIQGNKITTYNYYEDFYDNLVERDTTETLW